VDEFLEHFLEGLEELFVIQRDAVQSILPLKLELGKNRGHVLVEQLLESCSLVSSATQFLDQAEQLPAQHVDPLLLGHNQTLLLLPLLDHHVQAADHVTRVHQLFGVIVALELLAHLLFYEFTQLFLLLGVLDVPQTLLCSLVGVGQDVGLDGLVDLSEVLLVLARLFIPVQLLESFDDFDHDLVDFVFLELHGEVQRMVLVLDQFVDGLDVLFSQHEVVLDG